MILKGFSMRMRFKASGALLLTAFFAAAGAFHQHPLPTASHEHAGFCSAASTIALESCAICKAVHTVVQLAAAVTEHTIESNARLIIAASWVSPHHERTLHGGPRAPPTA
jgi:hypothetical protein